MAKVKAFREEEPSSSSKQVHLPTLLNAYSLCMAFSIAHQCLNFCRWCIQMEVPLIQAHRTLDQEFSLNIVLFTVSPHLVINIIAIGICTEITLVSVTCFNLLHIHVFF